MRAKDTDIPIAYLRGCFSYDAEAGALKWRERPLAHFPDERVRKAWNARYAGKIAGSLEAGGHLTVDLRVDGQRRRSKYHRIVFALVNGRWPDHQIDHENRDKAVNKIENLREATQAQNMQNISLTSRNTSGVRGVSRFKPLGKWRADIRANGELLYLGLFDTREEASAARSAAEILLHPFRPKPKTVDLVIPDGAFVDGVWSIEGKSTVVKGLAKPTWTTSATTVFTYDEAARAFIATGKMLWAASPQRNGELR